MSQPLDPQEKPIAKKPYSSPEIQVYGDFREITNTSTHKTPAGMTDGSIHPNRTK